MEGSSLNGIAKNPNVLYSGSYIHVPVMLLHTRQRPGSHWETTSAENRGNREGVTGSRALLLPGVLGTSLGLSQLSNITACRVRRGEVIVMEFHPRTAICQSPTFSLTFSDSFQVFVSWHLFLLPAIRKLHF